MVSIVNNLFFQLNTIFTFLTIINNKISIYLRMSVKKFRDIPHDVIVVSQSELFYGIFNNYAENYQFVVGFQLR